MPLKIWSTVFFALTLGFVAAFLLPQSAIAGQPMILPTDPAPLVAVTAGGERSFSIEIAQDDLQRAAGLMFREWMADDHGMLFVFDQTQPVGFWMKNTPMPLDLVFVREDGSVESVGHGEPFSEALIPSRGPVRFVLELKAGIAEKAGIKEGVQLRHPAIAAASAN
ncbi:hypothetical protein C7441_11582 [Pseudaminobacter salicylatoxidans]|uniref:DUF192 domain-containing protein n=1 Tax=Pseudaminobacter salicylatoxidans TaxID=93369 RepID=A0A316BYN3_PSESE|nr:DUF192 domain-containing protein [Pseudaminobacter salicylatoxidans]PWJ79472.1 hypothetical protein C7441_11582 [Pseudaminobacter salicylatoxidans]